MVSITIFVALTFNIQNVFADDVDDLDPGINDNNNDYNNNDDFNNDDDTDYNNNDDFNNDNDTDYNNDNDYFDDEIIDDEDESNFVENLIYGTGGVALGALLTYFLIRNKETI